MLSRPHLYLALLFVFIATRIAAAEPFLLSDFRSPASHYHGDFDSADVTVSDGALRINTPAGRGGAVWRGALPSLADYADRVPRIHLTVGPANTAHNVRLILQDGSGNRRSFTFNIRHLQSGQATVIVANDSAPLRSTDPERPFNPHDVVMWQIQGAWNDARHDLAIHRVELVPLSLITPGRR